MTRTPTLLARLAAVALLAAFTPVRAGAVCPSPPTGTLSCGDSVAGQLDPGTWTGTSPPGNCDAGFDALASTLGSSDCAATAPSFCASALPSLAGWTCSTGPTYPCGTEAFGEGPEDVYEVVCPTSGELDLALTGIDCDLDLYVLDDACDPASCTYGSTNGTTQAEGGTTFCTPGLTYYVVVEGFGFTQGGYLDGGASYCDTHTATPAGSYTLALDCVDTTPEDCDTPGDEDGDGDADCADADCFAEAFCCDDDGDGFDDLACGGGDCDDTVADPPSADSDGDGVLDDCDSCPDAPNATQVDTDGDGFGDICDLCPGVDDGADGDGDTIVCANDCDDTDPDNFPGNDELCDGADNDCDGTIDEDVLTQDYWPDSDGDGFGDGNAPPVSTCDGAPSGHVADDTDCDDTSADTHPGASELEDGRDNDCDGDVDENTGRSDDDGDGFSEEGGDCDDGNAAAHPGLAETCDGVDNDCDGDVDDGTACADDDGDGFCEGPTCVTGQPGDCDDTDAAVSPGATEVQGNGLDDDCDGVVDGDDPDPDGDGVSEAGGDCAPEDGSVHPGAVELENGVDDDCDGTVDEGTAAYDDDGDGASENGGDCHDGDPAVGPAADESENGIDDDCDGQIDEGTDAGDDDGDGFTENGGDCDDATQAVSPGATEVDNGVDDDCDGEIDEGTSDRDGDGYTSDDCDDGDGFVNPGTTEICDRVDNDCDGEVDEGCDEDTDSTSAPEESSKCAHTAPTSLVGLGLVALAVARRRR